MPGPTPYTYGGTTTTNPPPPEPWWKRAWDTFSNKVNNDPMFQNANFAPLTGPQVENYKTFGGGIKKAQETAKYMDYYNPQWGTQWLNNNPAMQITLGENRVGAMDALARRRALMEKYGLQLGPGLDVGILSPYGVLSGVGQDGDPMQDANIFNQIAYLQSSEPIRKQLGIETGPAGFAGGPGGGGGMAAAEPQQRRGGGGGGGEWGNSGYPQGKPKNYVGNQMPRWVNNLVAWRVG